MKEAPPSIQLRDKGGWLAAQDGLVISFYLNTSPEEVAPAIWRSLQRYLQVIPPKTLNWYVSDEGDMAPLDDMGWEQIRQYLLEPPWNGAWAIELSESPSEAGSYQFEYYGRRPGDPLYKDPTTSVSFAFPTQDLREHGALRMRALALELAEELPFNFGYVSPAIVSPHGYWSSGDGHLLEALLNRYPSLDLYHASTYSSLIGTQALSPTWLTFLGQPLLGQMGGIDALRNALSFPEVSLLPMDGDRVLVTLDEWPALIDTEREAIPPQYRALARLMEPFLFQYKSEELLPYQQDMNRRIRRFL
ncbi:DUF3396 domain-containing protein [Corallococcus macrosporus]|uniref:DUF3396 domain-containing protein n=1 Tax=Corallococcus macrosporus TaxID=35 RepID=A0ABS3DLC7_9BACT|nr:type VI immunity family protein [Corallococcus macrosporus]MBN8232135.1 DUF3396 domain-containing protein [Corallococcus macrosporus]